MACGPTVLTNGWIDGRTWIRVRRMDGWVGGSGKGTHPPFLTGRTRSRSSRLSSNLQTPSPSLWVVLPNEPFLYSFSHPLLSTVNRKRPLCAEHRGLKTQRLCALKSPAVEADRQARGPEERARARSRRPASPFADMRFTRVRS